MKKLIYLLILPVFFSCGESESSKKENIPPYAGDKVDGKMDGLGYFTNLDGKPKVLGEFRNDSINGIAELHADNGGYYSLKVPQGTYTLNASGSNIFGEPIEGRPEGGASGMPSFKPTQTKRTYERVNRPGMTNQGFDQAMAMTMAGAAQPKQAGALSREIG